MIYKIFKILLNVYKTSMKLLYQNPNQSEPYCQVYLHIRGICFRDRSYRSATEVTFEQSFCTVFATLWAIIHFQTQGEYYLIYIYGFV